MLSHKKFCILIVLLLVFSSSYLQAQPDTINERDIKDMLTFLASDRLRGRVNYSKEQWVAADFIAKKFEADGLLPFPGFQYYFQPFAPQAEKAVFKFD